MLIHRLVCVLVVESAKDRFTCDAKIFLNVSAMQPMIFSDCGDPTTDQTFAGYTFGTSTGTTYQSTHQITGCDPGYDGSASQTLTCEASGSWTTPTGCTIKGISHLLVAILWKKC